MYLKEIIFAIALIAINVTLIDSHGRVVDPVHRGYAWRLGFNVTADYNDMGNFCGGYAVHHKQNGGKCGLCGDNYALKAPRDNENGGTYGSGTIVKTYKAGQVIDVDVHLTAAHLGHFEFSVCPLESPLGRETEECFDAHKLKLADGSGYKYTKVRDPRHYKIKLVLPENLKCEHCVFRWHYRTGNVWGICENNVGGLGCGPQEVFRTCSDIKIV